jgi:transposase
MYSQLEEMVHATGALLFFLPPYSPQLNPIELGFSLLKRWLKRHAPLAFRFDANRTLAVAMTKCTEATKEGTENLYRHCGYETQALNKAKFFE